MLLWLVILAWCSSCVTAGQATALQSCLLDAKLTVVSSELSSVAEYYAASASDNVVYHYNPTAIVYPTNTAGVQSAVVCASRNNAVAVTARSGGHSFAGYGSGGMDGSLIIDLTNMTSIVSDLSHGTVEMQPAVRLGDVIKTLWHDGKRAIATGTCPSVGIGGLTLCGGVGPMSRVWGLTTDSLLEVDIVLANGTALTVSDDNHAEIMWALRGSGSMFGIVTRMVFQTQDVSHPVSYFEYRWVQSLVDAQTATRVVMAIQSFAMLDNIPNEVGFHIQIKRTSTVDSHVAIHMQGSYIGPLSEWKVIEQLLFQELATHNVPQPDTVQDTEDTYLALLEAWDEFGRPGNKLNTVEQHKIHNNYITKSSVTLDHRKGFTPEAFQPVMQLLWDTKSGNMEKLEDGKEVLWAWNLFLEYYGGSDPLYRRSKAREASSFANRDGLWIVQAAVGSLAYMTISPSGHAFAVRFGEHIAKAMAQSGLERGGYPCYVDSDLREEEWKQLYYGPSIPRLEKLKMDLDPHNLFRNPQTLGTKDQILSHRRNYH